MKTETPKLLLSFLFLTMAYFSFGAEQAAIGIFEGSTDIGSPGKPGSAQHDASAQTYTLAGGGENMWFTNDSLRFVWSRVSGDFELQAAFKWLTTGGNAHRKGCLLVRQDLSPDGPYVDVALHGDGLTSLQFRTVKGGLTREVQANVKSPAVAALRRQGDSFIMLLGADSGSLKPSGSYIRMKFRDPLYVGLGVCAHDDKALERAQFTDVKLTRRETSTAPAVLHSTLEIIPVASKDRRVVYHTQGHIEAPNWSPDGSFLLFNSKGSIFKLGVQGGEPERVDTGFAGKCNNDHGISPDGRQMVISDQSKTGKSLIYTLPISGGEPRQITEQGPSYWHGWSPDSKTLAYCAERNGEFDVYAIPVEGGKETRLTNAKGLDDGPEYSPDGKYIYFNSDRTGTMQIWRMGPDGSGQEQVTKDEFNNWFAHPSPDGKWLVFLSYEKEVQGHPENKEVRLRLMPLGGGPIQELAHLFGGQGTINVPSWSPDSKQLAFVSYELIKP